MKPTQALLRTLTCPNLLPRSTLPFPRTLTDLSIGIMTRPRAFILDFDGTITEKDTIGSVADIGIEWQAKRGLDMNNVWKELVSSYGSDFDDHVRSYTPVEEDRRTLEQEIGYQRGLWGVETRSFGRVSASALFEGMSSEVWEAAGRQAFRNGDVVVREGFREFIEEITERGDTWGVVSVNFSESFIRGVIEASAGQGAMGVEILANHPDENGVLHGPDRETQRVIATSDAKLASMKALLRTWSDRGSDISKLIYVGDSGTDIECLMEAGVVGVVMSDTGQSNLTRALGRVQVNVVFVNEYMGSDSEGNEAYLAHNFREIAHSRLVMDSFN